MFFLNLVLIAGMPNNAGLEQSVVIEDTRMFDRYQTVREANWKIANLYEEWIWKNEYLFIVKSDYIVHKERAKYISQCWYWLNEAYDAYTWETVNPYDGPAMYEKVPDYERRLKALSELRKLVGETNFYGGYMPVPLSPQ